MFSYFLQRELKHKFSGHQAPQEFLKNGSGGSRLRKDEIGVDQNNVGHIVGMLEHSSHH